MTESHYKNSGVDVEVGDQLVDWLQSSEQAELNSPSIEVKRLYQENVVDGIGGFASLFRINPSSMKKPCLVTCTDGVGTKVLLASHFDDYSTVGQDLVAMCVNDLVCTGGVPLLFLDYYAVGKLNLAAAKQFLSGVRRACHASGCALVGGETAEMPGVYQGRDFDCAGFAVGVVDEDLAWGARRVRSGDQLIGISSSGFHSNGYSLLRKIFANDLERFKERLLTPTALYPELVRQVQMSGVEISAAAHITGGGIENIPRVLPGHLKWEPRWWVFPEVFLEVQKRTQMSDDEMRKTLNCGIGFVFVLPPAGVQVLQKLAIGLGFETFDLGRVTE